MMCAHIHECGMQNTIKFNRGCRWGWGSETNGGRIGTGGLTGLLVSATHIIMMAAILITIILYAQIPTNNNYS